jgi:hypothetical protein
MPSSKTAPGKPRCWSSEAPQPSRPAAAATAKTLRSDHVEAARVPWLLPAGLRRMDEAVKLCRPAAQRVLFRVATDRPMGLAALVKRIADMPGRRRSIRSI